MRHHINLEALADLFTHRIAAVSDLVHIGLSGAFVLSRCGPAGPWQRLLPGILLLAKAPPTRAQRIHAALRYAGPHAVVTGLDALQLHRMHAVPTSGPVHLLVAGRGGARGCTDVIVERTSRMPAPVLRQGFFIAPPARAALDAVRRLKSLADVRAVLDEVAEFVDIATLHTELVEAPRRGTTLPRQVLTGTRTTAPTLLHPRAVPHQPPAAASRRPARRTAPPLTIPKQRSAAVG